MHYPNALFLSTQSFISQHHSHKSLANFVLMLARQGHEAEHVHKLIRSAREITEGQPFQFAHARRKAEPEEEMREEVQGVYMLITSTE